MQHAAPQLRLTSTQLSTGPRVHFAERGRRGGEPVVLLHGWPDSWFTFSRVLPLLPERCHAFAYDQRGFGESDKPDCCYSMDDFAGDVVAFLDAVELEHATLVGHSYGSFVARRAAELHPRRVSRLVLIGSALHPRNEVLLGVRAMVDEVPDPAPEDFVRDFQASTAFLPLPADFFERIVEESMKVPRRLWPDMLDAVLGFDDTTELRHIAAPTTLLWGEHDALFSRQDQEQLADAIRGAKLITYADTGHCPNWERPGQVAADLDVLVGGR